MGIEQRSSRNPRTVLHWYDFLCPFCYIGRVETKKMFKVPEAVDCGGAGQPPRCNNATRYCRAEETLRRVRVSE